MTLEHGHEPTEWGSVPRPTPHATSSGTGQPVHYNSARHGSHVEESPELLRWRADLLMDEMMMGGVDLSAADGNRTFSGLDAPIVQRSQTQPTTGQSPSNGNSYHGGNGQPTRENNVDRNNYDRGSYERGGYDQSTYNNHYENGNNGYSHNGQSNGQVNGQANGYTQPRPSDQPRSNGTNGNGTYGGGYPSPSSANQQHNNDNPPVTPRENYQTGEPRDFGTSEYGRNGGATQPDSYQGDARSYDAGHHDANNYNGREGTRPYDDGRERGYYDREINGDVQEYPSTNVPPSNSQSSLRTTMDDVSTPSSTGQNGSGQNGNGQPVAPPPTNQVSNQTANPPQMATRPPLPPIEPTRQPTPSRPPRVTPPVDDAHTQWATGPDKWEYQDFAADPQAVEEEDDLFAGYTPPERKSSQDSAVRQDPAHFVSAMSVMGSSKKRSTLLPRSSELDIDNLHREISDLHGEIAALLPVGNETSERARHLLDKAYSILQSDPSRSAEVEYYMQQVRTIVVRLHQARQWSDLYRKRLNLYLWAWLGLSAVMLIATFLFQYELEESLMWLLGVGPDNVLVENWTTFLGTAFAGALGGAIGALYTMEKHARGEHSFFDRKYGLRGLILPFMGLIVGALGYVIFGLIFALLGVDPSENLTVAIIPIMAAFAFGFSQESIYGTRS